MAAWDTSPMRRSVALGVALFAGWLATGCGSVRATGPKTALDRCIDGCDTAADWCGVPAVPECRMEYDACVLRCGQKSPNL